MVRRLGSCRFIVASLDEAVASAGEGVGLLEKRVGMHPA
jgi:hypothetical protein